MSACPHGSDDAFCDNCIYDERDVLARQVAALREAAANFRGAHAGSGMKRGETATALEAALRDTSASALAWERRVRAEERERCARVLDYGEGADAIRALKDEP